MAAFGGYSNQQNMNTPTIYGYSFFNKESTVSKTMMQFSMWKTTLKIAIYPLIESDSDEVKYDRKNGCAIFLVPAKAKMLADIIKGFKQDQKKYNGMSIPAGQGLISIVSGEYFGKKDAGPCIIIRKVNYSTGQVELSYAFETRQKLYNVVTAYDEKTGKFDQDFEQFKDLDLDMIVNQLEAYYHAMTNAFAFSTIDNMYPYLDKIASKLGVDLNSNFNGGTISRSYFSNRQDSQPQDNSGGLAQQSGISFGNHSPNPYNSLNSLMG